MVTTDIISVIIFFFKKKIKFNNLTDFETREPDMQKLISGF